MPKAKTPAIHLPSALLAAATAKARSQNQTIEVYLSSLVEADLGQPTAAALATLIATAPLIGGEGD